MVIQVKSNSDNYSLPIGVQQMIFDREIVFNPSIVESASCLALALRVWNDVSASIESELIQYDYSSKTVKRINLSTKFKDDSAIQKVADPKLFKIGKEIWCTFNTGHVKGSNQLFIFQVYPVLGVVRECLLDGRQETEKNWCFFERDGDLFALYNLSPLKILKVATQDERSVKFEPYLVKGEHGLPDLSLGTQIAFQGNTGYLVAHKKYYFRGKRAYLGVPLCFNKDTFEITRPNDKLLTHSYWSMLGNLKKFNKNLISCTYFSGIHLVGGDVLLSYGVNDMDWRIVKTKIHRFWN